MPKSERQVVKKRSISGSPGILVCQGLAMPEVGGSNAGKGENVIKIKTVQEKENTCTCYYMDP